MAAETEREGDNVVGSADRKAASPERHHMAENCNLLSAARISAIQTLQKIRSRFNPGSFNFDVADHAIDLALSPRRNADGFLVRNTLRDSKRILCRQKAKGPTMLSLDEEFFANGHDGGDSEEISWHDRCASPDLLPDQICLENDFENALRQRLDNALPAMAALDCVKHGATTKDFCQETGMSPSYFKKLKKTIQEEAAALN
jgi:hypothetical protein